MKNTLSLIRQKIGHGKITTFVRKELGVNYRTFVYQLSRDMVPYKTIKILLKKLGITFEELRDYKYTPNAHVHSQKIRQAEESLRQLHLRKPKKLSELLQGK